MNKKIKGRFISILLSSMQSFTVIVTIFSLIFTFVKEPSYKMIIKSYMRIAFINKIDEFFVDSLPPSLKENA